MSTSMLMVTAVGYDEIDARRRINFAVNQELAKIKQYTISSFQVAITETLTCDSPPDVSPSLPDDEKHEDSGKRVTAVCHFAVYRPDLL